MIPEKDLGDMVVPGIHQTNHHQRDSVVRHLGYSQYYLIFGGLEFPCCRGHDQAHRIGQGQSVNADKRQNHHVFQN